MLRAKLRTVWRALRDVPLVGRVLGLADRVWWMRLILRSGLVDVAFYRAQCRWRLGGERRVAWHYVRRGYRRGMSPNPLFEELYAGRNLPEVFRVPALYAYLVSDKPTVPVHPWWDAVAYGRGLPDEVAAAGPLEDVWRGPRGRSIRLRAGGASSDVPFERFRGDAIDAARQWAAGGSRRFSTPKLEPLAVVRLLQTGDRAYDVKLNALATIARDGGVAPAAVFVAPSAGHWIAASTFGDLNPSVRVIALRGSSTFGACVDETLAGVDAQTVLIVDPRCDLGASDLLRLAGAAADGDAVTPASCAQNGTLIGLGAVDVGAFSPWRILNSHPVEDLDGFGRESIPVPLLTGRTVAMPLAAYRAAGGLRRANGIEELSRRMRAAKPEMLMLVDTAMRPVLAEPDRVFASARSNRRSHWQRARALTTDPHVADLVRRAGFDIVGWEASDGVPRPRLAWRRPAPGAARWAIKISAPAGPNGQVWGDTHFAHGLASALRRRGVEVVVDHFGAGDRPTSYLDDVSVVVRGPHRIDPPRTGIRMQWIISHPDEITRDEVDRFDRVFAVSPRWARAASLRFGVDIQPLLEATDVDLFHPRGLPRGADILFVGTARGIPRPSVVGPLRAGIAVKVYGPDWRPFIPASAVVAPSIPNAELSTLYEGASIVLNDHWPAMRREGFMAMRPFDVVAAGGRVVSENVDGLAELFGGAVVVYDSDEQLIDILRRDPVEVFPPDDELAVIAARIRQQHSFDARAAGLLEAAEEARVLFGPVGAATGPRVH